MSVVMTLSRDLKQGVPKGTTNPEISDVEIDVTKILDEIASGLFADLNEDGKYDNYHFLWRVDMTGN